MNKPTKDTNQIDRFKEAARELDCNEDEAAFDEKLKEVAEHKPIPRKDSLDQQKP